MSLSCMPSVLSKIKRNEARPSLKGKATYKHEAHHPNYVSQPEFYFDAGQTHEPWVNQAQRPKPTKSP